MVVKSKLKTKGTAARYVSRAQALRRLQLSLSDFRRLCILKGIYPRTPKRMQNGNVTYYYAKDIQYLQHEPLLHKFREIKAHLKHVHRRQARREWAQAASLRESAPAYTLDHLIRERYPAFPDALADLDDALSAVHLFAAAGANKEVPQAVVANCTRLCREWQMFTVRSGTLKKAFISVKGVYFGATVHGVDVTWMAPHRFAVPESVEADYKVLATFLEFYQALIGFVLYRLYTKDLQAPYPPKIADSEAASGAWLAAIVPEGVVGGSGDRVFAGLSFAVGREVPAPHIELTILGGGGACFFDDAVETTHCVVDRPLPEHRRQPGRIYVQPQWVFDSLNAGIPLPTDPYAPGASLPPHLSPFVVYATEDFDLSAETHIPERAREIQALIEAHNAAHATQVELPFAATSVAAARARLMAAGGRAAIAEPGELADEMAANRAALHAAEVAAEIGEDDFLGADAAPALPAPVDEEEAKSESEEPVPEEDAEHQMRRSMMRNKDAKRYRILTERVAEERDRVRTLEKKAKKAKK